MTVQQCANWNPEFPEIYRWGSVDSPKLCSIASALVNRIEHERKIGSERLQTPGLREALRVIAEVADI